MTRKTGFRIAIGVIAGFMAIVAIPFIAAAFMDTTFTVEHSIVIAKPREAVFGYVRHLKNQEQYNVWLMRDPDRAMTYEGTDGTVGFVAAWDSDNPNVGKGEQEIMAIHGNERLEVEIRFERPFEAVNPAHTTVEAVGDGQSRVTMTYFGTMPYPLNLMIGSIVGQLGGEMDETLANLKAQLEQDAV